MVEFFVMLPFSSGPLHDIGLLLVLAYALCVGAVYQIAAGRNHAHMLLLMMFTVVAGLTGWGFLLAFGWARYGMRKA